MFQKTVALGFLLSLAIPSIQARADVVCAGADGQLKFFSGATSCTAGLTVVDLNNLVKAPAGVKGATGPKGASGPTGATGNTGATGAKGAKGGKGTAGAKGATGAKGDTGATGPSGTKGATGAKGATGIQGIPGLPGDKGLKGQQGAKGEKGATGIQGIPGEKGTPGAVGTNGLQGIQGAKGDAGSFSSIINLCTNTVNSGTVTNPVGSPGPLTYPAPPVAVKCPAGQFLLDYTFNIHAILVSTHQALKIPPVITRTTLPGGLLPDGISVDVTLSKVANDWETAPYSAQLICCPATQP